MTSPPRGAPAGTIVVLLAVPLFISAAGAFWADDLRWLAIAVLGPLCATAVALRAWTSGGVAGDVPRRTLREAGHPDSPPERAALGAGPTLKEVAEGWQRHYDRDFPGSLRSAGLVSHLARGEVTRPEANEQGASTTLAPGPALVLGHHLHEFYGSEPAVLIRVPVVAPASWRTIGVVGQPAVVRSLVRGFIVQDALRGRACTAPECAASTRPGGFRQGDWDWAASVIHAPPESVPRSSRRQPELNEERRGWILAESLEDPALRRCDGVLEVTPTVLRVVTVRNGVEGQDETEAASSWRGAIRARADAVQECVPEFLGAQYARDALAASASARRQNGDFVAAA